MKRYIRNTKEWMIRGVFSKWLTKLDKEVVKAKGKVLLLLDNCTTHCMDAHLSAVELLFLHPNTSTRLERMNQRVIANFKVHCWRWSIKRLLIDVLTANSIADQKVPLMKAIFFVNGAQMDVKPQIILNCLKKAGFSRHSSVDVMPAEDRGTTVDFAAAADGADVAVHLK